MHSHNRTLIAKLGFADADKKLQKHDIACQYLGEPAQMMKLLRVIRPDLAQEKSPAAGTWEDFVVAASEVGLSVRLDPQGELASVSPKNAPSGQTAADGERAWMTRSGHVSERLASVASGHSEPEVRLGKRLTSVGPPTYEAVVLKGTGDYATAIGFLDLLFGFGWAAETNCRAVDHAASARNAGREMLAVLNGLVDFKGRSPTKKELKDLEVACRDDYDRTQSVVKFIRDGGEKCSDSVVVEVKIAPVTVGDLIRQMNFYRQHDTRNVKHWMVATDYPVSRPDVATLKQADLTHIKLGAGFEEYLKRRQVEESFPSTSPEI